MHARFWLVCALAIVVIGWAISPRPAQAVEKSGTAIAVVQSTFVEGGAGDRMLTVDGPLYMGDVIRTGPTGQAQITLLDNTKLVVGPNSYMTVDAFVFDSNNQAQKVTLNAVRGAFRFLTGTSRKDAYTIKTPTATIGVRGTEFDFSVARGQMAFALYEGEARLCNRRRECVVLSDPCSIAVSQRFRPVRAPASLDERKQLLANAFPFIDKQKRLRSGFRVDTSSCSLAPAGFGPRGADVAPSGFASFGGSGGGSGSFSSFSSFGGAAVAGPSATGGNGNNGFGNGGEGSEGSTETGNPGQGGGGGGGKNH